MQSHGGFSPGSGRQFNTLAQTGTGKIKRGGIFTSGNGTILSNKERLQSWAQKKMISQTIIPRLVDIAKEKGDLARCQQYWNTYHCFSRIFSSGNSVFGKYCKNRSCLLCNGIKKADKINHYHDIIATWEAPFFLTITATSVPAEGLKKRIDEMFYIFNKIIAKFKKRFQRGTGIKFMGIKVLECNFNPIALTYNPHFHLILPNLQVADALLREWRIEGNKLWGVDKVGKGGQDNQRVKDLEKKLIEILKYSTKIFTDPSMRKAKKGTVAPVVYLAAFDNIIAAMKGHRIFDRFGFNLPKKPKVEGKFNILHDYKEWKYDFKSSDWNEIEGALTLSGYDPPPELIGILENNINIASE